MAVAVLALGLTTVYARQVSIEADFAAIVVRHLFEADI